jgi:hypothetical protein
VLPSAGSLLARTAFDALLCSDHPPCGNKSHTGWIVVGWSLRVCGNEKRDCWSNKVAHTLRSPSMVSDYQQTPREPDAACTGAWGTHCDMLPAQSCCLLRVILDRISGDL